MCVFAVFAFRNSFINDKANHANMFLACRKKNEEKKPIKSKRKTYLRPFSPKNRNNDKRKHVFLKTTRVFGLERLFCYCLLLTSGGAVTRDKLGGVSHFHSVFGQAFSLLSPRPLPLPLTLPISSSLRFPDQKHLRARRKRLHCRLMKRKLKTF